MFIRNASNRGSGPAALFALIEAPRHAFFPAEVARHPVRYSALFILPLLVLTVCFVMAQIDAPQNGAAVDLLPTEATIVLMMGLAVFPLRLIAVPLLAYALVFVVGFGMKLALEPGYLPPGTSPWVVGGVALLANGVIAAAAAFGGRAASRWARQSDTRSDAVLATVTILLFFALACGAITVAVGAYPESWKAADFGEIGLTGAGIIRALRIAFCAGVLMLFLLDVPSWPDFRRALAVQPLFFVGALAAITGHALHPTVDINVLMLAVALLLPGYAAILAAIMGLSLYVALTGAGLAQVPIASQEIAALEVLSLILMVMNFFILLVRHQMHLQSGRNRETFGRVERVHAFASIGYFVFDVSRARVHLDEVAASMLGTGSQFDANEFIERVRPADRPNLVRVMADRSREATLTAFSLSPGPLWDEGAEGIRHVAIYSWYECLWDGRTIAYGALLDRTDEHNRATALGKALADLSEQQNRQTQLFSIVSHEIRTPASVVSMLVEEMDAGATWTEMGPRLKAVSEQLLSVLADMRQTVRPEENLPIRMETFRPQELAETVRNTFLLMAEARGVDLVLNLSAEADQERVTDRVRLIQVLSNLVKNALIHAECRRITISYAEDLRDGSVMAQWRVTDDGRGISPVERARLFLPFSRLAGTQHARVDGSGLGLYVSKTSIELLGGSVEYRDAVPHGSDFVITVPEGRGATPVPVAKVDAASVAAGFRKVLVVEDSDLIGELLVARLQRLVPTVIWARSGLEGLEMQAKERPDVILTDLFMPKMGGDEMTATLRAQGVATPIIGMTAAAIGDERTTFEQAGTDFVLTKPVSTAQLMEALSRLSAPADPA
jgi:signal transduction histidine kinase